MKTETQNGKTITIIEPDKGDDVETIMRSLPINAPYVIEENVYTLTEKGKLMKRLNEIADYVEACADDMLDEDKAYDNYKDILYAACMIRRLAI